MPSFGQVLEAVIEAWQSRRGDIVGQAPVLYGRGRESASAGGAVDRPCAGRKAGGRAVRKAAERLSSMFDPRDGGFGSAPKFPQPLLLDLCLRDHRPLAARARRSRWWSAPCEAMASGGIYDHLGGGFARYSVDSHWSVPHFEKMLYDQALIARVYLHSWQTGRRRPFLAGAGRDGFLRARRPP